MSNGHFFRRVALTRQNRESRRPAATSGIGAVGPRRLVAEQGLQRRAHHPSVLQHRNEGCEGGHRRKGSAQDRPVGRTPTRVGHGFALSRCRGHENQPGRHMPSPGVRRARELWGRAARQAPAAPRPGPRPNQVSIPPGATVPAAAWRCPASPDQSPGHRGDLLAQHPESLLPFRGQRLHREVSGRGWAEYPRADSHTSAPVGVISRSGRSWPLARQAARCERASGAGCRAARGARAPAGAAAYRCLSRLLRADRTQSEQKSGRASSARAQLPRTAYESLSREKARHRKVCEGRIDDRTRRGRR